jgi:hypothetical protein
VILSEELEDLNGQLIKLQTVLERRIIPALGHNDTARFFLQDAYGELDNARQTIARAALALGMAQDA